MAANEHLLRIGRQDAHNLIATFLPMFVWLNQHKVNYCLVGGLAVLIQGLKAGKSEFRATVDADIMFDFSFTNFAFAQAYLETYASDVEYGPIVYDAVFGEGAFDELSTEAQSLVSASFIGADIDIDGISTPDFDVVRELNGVNLSDIESEEIEVMGFPVKVATAEQLLLMKERTIELLHTGFEVTSRPQDYIDAGRLREIIAGFGIHSL